MSLSVVGPGSSRGGHGDLSGILGDSQGSDGLIYYVVLSLCCAVPLDLAAVSAGAYVSLSSGGGQGGGLTVYQTLEGSFAGQRLAVIDLLCIRSYYGQDSRCHGDGSVHIGDLHLVGDILSGLVPDHQIICRNGDRLLGDVGDLHCGFRLLQGVSLRKIRYGDGCLVGLTIVDVVSACGGDDDVVLRLGHSEASQCGFDLVVVFLCGLVPAQQVAVGAGSYFGLGSGGQEGGFLTIHESGDASLSGEALAVIDLGL